MDKSGLYQGYVDPIKKQVFLNGTPNVVMIINGNRVPIIARYGGLAKGVTPTCIQEFLSDDGLTMEVTPEEYFYLLEQNVDSQKKYYDIKRVNRKGSHIAMVVEKNFLQFRAFVTIL